MGKSNNVLLLQGPIGPYFFQLGKFLQDQGKTVYKLNFNGGDNFYYPLNHFARAYFEPIHGFKDYLINFIQENDIDSVVCFGHRREYHVIAKQVCEEMGGDLSFWSFEEGYLRPHYITFEKWGVNSASVLPRNAEFYLDNESKIPEMRAPRPLVASFFERFWLAMHYYMAMYFCGTQFKHYIHHRDRRVLRYIGAWALSGWRKWFYRPKEYILAKSIEDSSFPDFFIVPLQVHNDSQVKTFGCAKNVPAFVRNVLRSFSKGADKDVHIIFKHHPMDRGFNHYGELILKLSQKYGVADRVHYVFDIPMPIFLRKAKGMVVINSTSGISALLHNMPVKAMGQAPYDFEGLTDQQPLSRFWSDPQKPDPNVFHAYRSYLLCRTQLNANFYINNSDEDFIQCVLTNSLQGQNDDEYELYREKEVNCL